MKRVATLAALALFATAPAAYAKHKHHDQGMMAMPTMEQCHDGYKAEFKDQMKWSKHKFKKACHKMMHDMDHAEHKKHHDAMKDTMMKDKAMKDNMMKEKPAPKKDM